jgi:thiosulfate/3-mercaptopyruvate sulfurtransferase
MGVETVTRCIAPLVSTDWLEAQLAAGELVIVDIRFAEEYAAGHIPGAVSAPFSPVSGWAESDDKLMLELPRDDDLFKLIGDCGITAESKVVVAGRLEEAGGPPYPLADAARVATTLVYAGVNDVAILDGAYPKWVEENRPVTTQVTQVTPVPYIGAPNRSMWVSTEYVKSRLGSSVIIDGRDADQYFGVSIDPFADMRGHIPTARSLPLVWVWEPDCTYRPAELIERMAAGVIGDDKTREVLAYCGVGGYASTWWFLLTQMFGYTNVKIYDGSMEAWVDEGNPLVQYTWTS